MFLHLVCWNTINNDATTTRHTIMIALIIIIGIILAQILGIALAFAIVIALIPLLLR